MHCLEVIKELNRKAVVDSYREAIRERHWEKAHGILRANPDVWEDFIQGVKE